MAPAAIAGCRFVIRKDESSLPGHTFSTPAACRSVVTRRLRRRIASAASSAVPASQRSMVTLELLLLALSPAASRVYKAEPGRNAAGSGRPLRLSRRMAAPWLVPVPVRAAASVLSLPLLPPLWPPEPPFTAAAAQQAISTPSDPSPPVMRTSPAVHDRS